MTPVKPATGLRLALAVAYARARRSLVIVGGGNRVSIGGYGAKSNRWPTVYRVAGVKPHVRDFGSV